MEVLDAARELSAVDLGDKRLNDRARLIVAGIQPRPDVSFPGMFGESDLEGFYRFTNNDAVELPKLLKPHVERSWDRASAEPYVLAVHDTTELSFPGEAPREGLAFTGTRSLLQLHVSLLVGLAEAPVVFGVAGMRPYLVKGELWGEVAAGGELEALASGSDRWQDAARDVRATAPKGTRLVHVMDREADDYALWTCIVRQGDDFVIRSAQGERRTGSHRHVATQLYDKEFIFGRKVHLSRRARDRPTKELKRHPPRDVRMAHLHVRAGPADILRPQNPWRRGLPKSLALNLVEVVEAEPPAGEDPITWRLVTSLPIATAEEVERVIDIYRKRWIIEEYFRALKTGCALEERQAESRWALLNVLGLLAPIAVSLLQLRVLGRHEPEAPAVGPLDELHTTVLRAATGKALPRRPTNRDVMLAVARLGGHLRSNGEPGWMVLGRGYANLCKLVEGWNAAMQHLEGLRKRGNASGESEM